MPVTAVVNDADALTMTITVEYSSPPERVWQLWADPRLLERWWGPPMYPATVVDHDLRPGGTVTYFMTGPEGDQHHGWWTVVAVAPPHRLELVDGFADPDGGVVDDLPTTRTLVAIDDRGDGGSLMTITSHFSSVEAMQQMLDMGVEEGMREALGQADALLQ